jgi:hypothetical protein
MDLNKKNKVLWNIETTLLNEVSYQLLINDINEINTELFLKKEDKRCSYSILSDFIKNKSLLQKYINNANIYLRKEKIKKLKI